MSDAQVPSGIGHISFIYLDSQEPQRLATFWAALLGVGIEDRPGQYLDLKPLPNGLTIGFQAVEEPKVAKNRLHFDINVHDLEEATARVEALGGRRIADVEDWRVMADPEGNEFCLIPQE